MPLRRLRARIAACAVPPFRPSRDSSLAALLASDTRISLATPLSGDAPAPVAAPLASDAPIPVAVPRRRRDRFGPHVAAAALVALIALGAPIGSAPVLAAGNDDAKRVAAVRLDADSLRKLETATEKIAAAVKANPALAREIQAADKADDDDDSDDKSGKSLAEMAAFYQSKAPLRQAIESSGMTADSYTVTMMALMQASMAWGMAQAVPADRRAKALAETGVSPANIEFVKQNQDRLDRMGKRLQALDRDR